MAVPGDTQIPELDGIERFEDRDGPKGGVAWGLPSHTGQTNKGGKHQDQAGLALPRID